MKRLGTTSSVPKSESQNFTEATIFFLGALAGRLLFLWLSCSRQRPRDVGQGKFALALGGDDGDGPGR
jgi:hypothetical protein